MVNHHPARGYIRIRNKYALGRDKHSERQICPEMVCEAAICGQHGRICNSSFLVIDGLNSAAMDRVNIDHNLGERHLNKIILVHLRKCSCQSMWIPLHVVLGGRWEYRVIMFLYQDKFNCLCMRKLFMHVYLSILCLVNLNVWTSIWRTEQFQNLQTKTKKC